MTTAGETTALAPRHDMGREQIELLKRTICAGSTDDELSMFVQTAQRLHLDPFARQVFAVKRWDSRERREVMAIQVSIDGFRLVAERTGKYAGQLGPFWSADGKEWVEVWLSKDPPAAAKVAVLRSDFKEPMWSVATWEQYKQTKKEGGLMSMWAKFGPLMLAKCAESLALRRAFPNELSGVYSQEEMAQASPDVEYTPPKPAPRANTVKHTGELASAKQVTLLHTLRGKVGGLVICDPKEPCPYKNGTLCGYHKQLAAFKDQAGNPVKSSKDLSPEQISNLIDRYEKKIAEQAKRADAGFAGAPSTAVDQIRKAMERGPLNEQELCAYFNVDSLSELPKEQQGTALALVLHQGTARFVDILEELQASTR